MTKHRPEFAHVTEPTPDHESLLSLVYHCGFIVATDRTRKMLDALVTLGMLSVEVIGRGKGKAKMRRYTPKYKGD